MDSGVPRSTFVIGIALGFGVSESIAYKAFGVQWTPGICVADLCHILATVCPLSVFAGYKGLSLSLSPETAFIRIPRA